MNLIKLAHRHLKVITPDKLSCFSSHITATLRRATELAVLVDLLFLYKDTTNQVDRPNINKIQLGFEPR